jgi:uncharacterized protein YkwD
VLLIVIVYLVYTLITQLPGGLNLGQLGSLLNLNKSLNISYPIINPPNNYLPQNQVIAYTLSLINNDRNAYGLANVSYTNFSSAQQHSQSMLENNYFSHWDTHGMKPYMRYTLLGGNGSVDENVAYIYNSSGVNVLNALKTMEYNMMYNDQACCNNGHRDNILTPQHNYVSVGVAYNKTTIYLTEDFINEYIGWADGTPNYSNGAATLKGNIMPGYSLSTIEISYDNPVTNMTRGQLDNTSSYGLGQVVAGIGHSSNGEQFYFQNITTINATTYVTQGQNFDVGFNLNNLIQKYGAGEYNILVFLTNNTADPNYCFTDSAGVQHCSNFIGASHTIFINQSKEGYVPQNV